MALRMARQLLFEAAASDSATAWSAAQRVAEIGSISWDGIVDAVLRAVVPRTPALRGATLLVWRHLCLPWYSEPHGSTTENGQFLKDLMAHAEGNELDALERGAAEAIAAQAQPSMKRQLLRVLAEAAEERGGGAHARAALALQANEDEEKGDRRQRSYSHLTDLTGVSAALVEELAENENAASAAGIPLTDRNVSYELRRAAMRLIARSAWIEAQAFAAAAPQLAEEPEVAMALVRVAVAAGDIEAARLLTATLQREEGWGWPSNRGRLRYHELRHLMGEPDAFAVAQADFVDDAAGARYGVGTILWETPVIFPLLFETVPWPRLWDRLEAEIHDTRDYRLGAPLEASNAVSDDTGLIAAIVAWGLSLGVPLVYGEAKRSLMALLATGEEALFAAVIENLLARETEVVMLGMDLLAAAVGHGPPSPDLARRIPDLAEHPDGGVAAAAMFLADRWGIKVAVGPRELPPFYRIELPEAAEVYGDAASDAQTRGMVIEDPLGWTGGWWNGLVTEIAKSSGLAPLQIRWRVRQLIQSWGGVETFGHQGSMRLEADLGRIGLKLTYRRPQSEVVLRALRHVLGDLWRAERLSARDWRYLLLRLYVHPDQPGLPAPEPRPQTVALPAMPRTMWSAAQGEWLDAIEGDLVASSARAEDGVLAEWRRSCVRAIRVTSTAEQWRGVDGSTNEHADLDDYLQSLPRVILMGSPITLYDDDEIAASRVALFEPNQLQGEPAGVLIFCPRTAAMLGWSSDRRRPDLYRDAQGAEMVGTQWWRDGLAQPIDEEERAAEGQRVVLTDAGKAAFDAMFGAWTMETIAWRRVEPARGDGEPRRRFARTSLQC